MYYAGTVLLNMTEEVFWKTTPRRLHALIEVHNEIASAKSSSKDKRKPVDTYIDQIPGW